MPEILKLNEISPVADKECSFNMHEYPLNDELLAVARAGAGTNNIPIPACTEKGIVVFNTPGANANAVKELVICELFLGGRKIVDAIEWVKTLKGTEGISKAVEKGKSAFVGHEILGKTLGVIGLGAIGVMVANTAVDLGMNVIGYDPYLSVAGALHLDNRVKTADLDTLMKSADFITVHVPLTPDTEKMFNAESIARMKDGAVLINNSRGEAMAAKELVDYIENGNITHSVNFPDVCAPRTTPARVCIMHKNVEGIIAKITSVVSGANVNISNLLDKSKKDMAYMILDLDQPLPEKAVKEIEKADSILRVRVIG